MDNKAKKIIISSVVIIIVFAAGFGSGYLFGKSSRPSGFPGGGDFQGIDGSVDRNTGTRQKQTPNQTQNQAPATNQAPVENQAE